MDKYFATCSVDQTKFFPKRKLTTQLLSDTIIQFIAWNNCFVFLKKNLLNNPSACCGELGEQELKWKNQIG
jgi:hypothetical protein